jgi:hypothetical protein
MHSSPFIIVWLIFFNCDFQSLGHLSPVDDGPDVLEVDWASILIIEVVGVLPHVHVQKGNNIGVCVRNNVLVLTGQRHDAVLRLVVAKPAPA